MDGRHDHRLGRAFLVVLARICNSISRRRSRLASTKNQKIKRCRHRVSNRVHRVFEDARRRRSRRRSVVRTRRGARV
jgi:hypothetical protein